MSLLEENHSSTARRKAAHGKIDRFSFAGGDPVFRRFLWGLLLPAFLIPSGSMAQNEKGVLVVTATPGAAVAFQQGNFQKIISKPLTARVVSLRLP